MSWIETDVLSNQNISSPLEIGSYTVAADGFIVADISLDQVAGAGDYVFYITRQINGAGSAYVVLPKTTATAASGETAIAGQTIAVSVRAGDVVKCFVDGLAGDTTTVDTTVRWHNAQFAIAGDAMTLTAAYDPAKTAAQSTDARFDYLDISIASRLASSDYVQGGGLTPGDIDNIWANETRTLTGQSAVITVVSPVASGGNISIIAGDSYKAADGRALSWSSTSWFDLTNQTLAFTCGDVALVPTFTGTYPAAQTVSLDMASSDTTAIKDGIAYGTAAEFRITAGSTDATPQIRTLVLARASVK